jgi:hypothetical protein
MSAIQCIGLSRPPVTVYSHADQIKALFFSLLHGGFPLQACQPARFSGSEERPRAVRPSHYSGHQLQVLLVDPPKGRLLIALEQPLHAARRFLVRQARHHVERHIDACRDPG